MSTRSDGPPPTRGAMATTTFSGRFAHNLRRLRGEAGLSQDELAFRAALHRTQISLLENGGRVPRAETLLKLAGALSATPNDLFAGIEWEPVVSVGGGLKVAVDEGSGGNG